MGSISIKYNGGDFYDKDDNLISKPIVYEGIELILMNGQKYVFDSGDIIKDWFNAKKKFIQKRQKDEGFGESHSVFTFLNNYKTIDLAYVKLIYDKPTLFYEITENGWLFIVPKDQRFTWQQLKEYCNDSDKI